MNRTNSKEQSGGNRIELRDIIQPGVTIRITMYDIIGEEKSIFVRKLSELMPLNIIEETDTHIRIQCSNIVRSSQEEKQDLIKGYQALLKTIHSGLEIVPLQSIIKINDK